MASWTIELLIVVFLSSALASSVASASINWDTGRRCGATYEQDSVRRQSSSLTEDHIQDCCTIRLAQNLCRERSPTKPVTVPSLLNIQRGGGGKTVPDLTDVEENKEERSYHDEEQDEKAKLDAMIEQLIQSVSSSEDMEEEGDDMQRESKLPIHDADREPSLRSSEGEGEDRDKIIETYNKGEATAGSFQEPKVEITADMEMAVDEVPVEILDSAKLLIDPINGSSNSAGDGKKLKSMERKSKQKSKSQKRTEKRKVVSDVGPSRDSAAPASNAVETKSDTAAVEVDRGAESQQASKASLPEASLSLPPQPPNALYRFLLRRGKVGHIAVLSLIVGVDWVEQYLPPVYNLSRMLLLRLHLLPDPKYAQQRRHVTPYYDDGTGSAPTTATNVEYAGIVSDDRGIGSSKLKKAKKKREDALALQKLIKVGMDISVAKYKHLSVDFMRRHGLGSFSSTEQEHPVEPDISFQDVERHDDEQVKNAVIEDEDSDTGDWIIEALATGNAAPTSIQEEEDVGAIDMEDWDLPDTRSRSAPSFTVGFQFGSGSKKKKKKRDSGGPSSPRLDESGSFATGTNSNRKLSSDAVLAAAAAATVGRSAMKESKKKRSAQPQRISDRDGGGGVLGRLRAATSESLLSRQLLGAYPGDAPSIEEAGDARGLFELARRYGYGDWSDEGDDEDRGGLTKKKGHRVRRKKKAITKGLSVSEEDDKTTGSTRTGGATRRIAKNAKSFFDDGPASSRLASFPKSTTVDKPRSPFGLTLPATRERKKDMEPSFDKSAVSAHVDRIKKKHRRPKLPLDNLRAAAKTNVSRSQGDDSD